MMSSWKNFVPYVYTKHSATHFQKWVWTEAGNKQKKKPSFAETKKTHVV